MSEIVEGGYQYPTFIPIDDAGKKHYEINAKAINAILGSLDESNFVKVMQLNNAKAIWDKIFHRYEGETKVKSVKLQTYRIQYETLRMHNDENIAIFFLIVDYIVNSMNNFGDEIKDTTVVENILRSLTPKFDSKVSAIEGMQDFNNLTIEQLHGILTSYEMRKWDTSGIREVKFKATNKWK